jgi:ABC-type nickel/cobalt efflux system permease component RcnA
VTFDAKLFITQYIDYKRHVAHHKDHKLKCAHEHERDNGRLIGRRRRYVGLIVAVHVYGHVNAQGKHVGEYENYI